MFRRNLAAFTDHPPDPRPPAARGPTFPLIAFLVALAVLLGFLLFYAQFSGSVRWLLGVSALAFVAMFAWSQVARRTAEPAPLVDRAEPTGLRDGELASFAAAVRRASRGLSYSQVMVASRARSAFLEHARLSFGLSPEAMRDVQADVPALRRMFGDDVLVEFLHLRSGDLEERYRWVVQARTRGGFSSEFHDVLARMEAWR